MTYPATHQKDKIEISTILLPFYILGVGGTITTALEVENTGLRSLGELEIKYQVHPNGEWWDWLSGEWADWLSSLSVGGKVLSIEGNALATLPAGGRSMVILDTRQIFALQMSARCSGTASNGDKTTLNLLATTFID
jgi:hypothetical protein